jgi:hypothetical protein
MAKIRTALLARGVVACLALTPAVGLAALPATAAPVSGPSPMTVNSGSGTVSDPWVPSKSATIVCDSATVWGNYNGTSHSTPLGTVYRGDTVSVRYETSDRNSVMAYSARANTWGFILRSCVQFA